MTSDDPRILRRFVLVGLVLPVLLCTVAVIVQVSMFGSLPDPVATHWGANGRPDAYGPAWIYPLLTVLVGLGLPALMVGLMIPGLRRGDRGSAYRLMAALGLGLSALLAGLSTASLVLQAGIADAAEAPSIVVAMIVSFALAMGAGVLGWFLQPNEPWRAERPAAVAPLDLAPGEDAVWLQAVSISRSGAIALVVATVILVAATVVTAVTAPAGVTWILGIVTVVVGVLVAVMTRFRVRVDREGLTVTGVFGAPRFRVAVEDVVAASVVQISPMADFGGWGVRLVPGRFGIVLRSGEGIEVTRAGRRAFAVTVDDARTGASLLEAYARRAVSAG
ncbi:hypothetical protein GCM10009808_13350 [Microbacterium sediminicola]|uniref:DUF1648 domain-containing protein n=1 Tax=Microbacterium sediminicola TaxID=415210 RepID=A0ABP4U176_9MICO